MTPSHHEQMKALPRWLRVAFVLMSDNYVLNSAERARLNAVAVHGTNADIMRELDAISAEQLTAQWASFTLEQKMRIWAKRANIKAEQHRKRWARKK